MVHDPRIAWAGHHNHSSAMQRRRGRLGTTSIKFPASSSSFRPSSAVFYLLRHAQPGLPPSPSQTDFAAFDRRIIALTVHPRTFLCPAAECLFVLVDPAALRDASLSFQHQSAVLGTFWGVCSNFLVISRSFELLVGIEDRKLPPSRVRDTQIYQ